MKMRDDEHAELRQRVEGWGGASTDACATRARPGHVAQVGLMLDIGNYHTRGRLEPSGCWVPKISSSHMNCFT